MLTSPCLIAGTTITYQNGANRNQSWETFTATTTFKRRLRLRCTTLHTNLDFIYVGIRFIILLDFITTFYTALRESDASSTQFTSYDALR